MSENHHHGLSVHEVVLLLETDPHRGIAEEEVLRRRAQFGPNELPGVRGHGVLRRIFSQLNSPLVYVLLAAGAVTTAFGKAVDATVIFAVVLVNTVVGYIQESRAESALDALRTMVTTPATVVREGRRQTVPSEDLVPGDLVLLEAGDRVPADARLVGHAELRVDESTLTGESEPVAKDETVLPVPTPVADRRNMVYSGTLVTAGTGAAVAVATGAETEIGQIHRLVGAVRGVTTPLTQKLARFSAFLTVAILVLAALTFAVGVARGQHPVDMFTAAVALAVGAIPEGLQAAVTVTLAIGVSRMARRRAVVRRLPVVETLGSTTVICSDKTGTFTENQMTVRHVWTPAGTYLVAGAGHAPEGAVTDAGGRAVVLAAHDDGGPLRLALAAAAVCGDATLSRHDGGWHLSGDPTEAAMVVAAAKAGLTREAWEAERPRTGSVPFSSERQYMATAHRDPLTGGGTVFAKGSVEAILRLCSGQLAADGSVEPLDPDAVHEVAAERAAEGLRVLATAVRWQDGAGVDEASLPGSMVLTGLFAMQDPPREAAASAVRACHEAGIAVKMITGDHAATATAIARHVGLADGSVLTGPQLAVLAGIDFDDAVEDARVFARVSPEQKLRLIESMQSRGHIVAMTGDGVNDAPALRQADIGIAMGRGGTEVAKEAADMVLTDDDFSTIEAAVEEGRGVFDNLTKFIVWTLPTNMGEGLVILVAIIAGTTLPILPTQILWINMTTAVLLGLMLAFEPKEPGIMARPPRAPDRPLLTGPLLRRTALVSALLLGATWAAFHWSLGQGASEAEARTLAVNLFVAVEAVYLFGCRSLRGPGQPGGLFGNRWLILGVGIQALAQLVLTYVPAMNHVFETAPLSGAEWLVVLAAAAAAGLLVAADKRLGSTAF
ncbi:HAD-IC family P-type ATPase [Sinomonas halotolerans]|uniref:HAD-IC family P-type ATPase n=1 Tax=Sinomonas halotolerans TaxID=1644133 RepID=A0ABU9WYT6_9MICC